MSKARVNAAAANLARVNEPIAEGHLVVLMDEGQRERGDVTGCCGHGRT